MGKHDNKALPAQVLKKFRIIYGSVRQHFREIEQICGVSGSQLWAMKEIALTPGIGISELSARLSIHQSTCSQLVEKLAGRNLITKERSKEDQRRVGLRPTAKAIKLIALAPGPAEGILPEALNALPADIVQTLDTALDHVLKQLQIKDNKLGQQPLSEL